MCQRYFSCYKDLRISHQQLKVVNDLMIIKSIKPTQDSSEHSEGYTKDCIKSDDWIEAGEIGNAVSCVAERNMGPS